MSSHSSLIGMPNCLECDSPLDPSIAGGLCPKCLLKLGVDNTTFFGMGPSASTSPSPAAAPVAAREVVRFGAYEVVRLLGKGGMGSVYEVQQQGTGRRLALKVLGQTFDSPQLRARFLREGQLAAAVRHPHVVGIIAAEEIEGVPVIAMELLHQGNLADQVKREGPQPPAKAVDTVLQIIDGLQAAQSAGVLHRDVKPANCFISADGMVKVGDFGLSISMIATGDQTLTQSGMTLGTPSFAAPEQLRGEDLDLRADIYSVGATLYYLLTGQQTHRGDNVGALIAAVLTKTPADPRSHRAEIPAALARLVMRCLEREKTKRPKNYEALRAALLPFSSEASAPALLGLRFIAGLVDVCLATLLAEIPASLMEKGAWLETTPSIGSVPWFAGMVIMLLYFALMEWRWGATPGKFLCGLRVRSASGDLPGFGAALLRVLVFALLPSLAELMAAPRSHVTTQVEPGSGSSSVSVNVSGDAIFAGGDLIYFLFFIGLFLTMRRANGYAAIQDLISRTRVVMAQSEEEDAMIPVAAISAPDTAERIGPFAVLSRHGAMVEGWDSSLKRMVWLVQREPGSAPLRARRQNLDRPARLRWFQAVECDGEHWEAFEAPPGQPLAVVACRNQPWSRVRRWLLDLATEFSNSARRGERLEMAGFNRVWITAQGRAIWLDFPLPTGGAEFRVSDAASLQEFLAAIAGNCLEPYPPLHASRLMETFAQQRLESADMIVGNLRATMELPGKLTWRRRLLSMALWPLMALAISLLIVLPTAGEISNEWRNNMAAEFATAPPAAAAALSGWMDALYSGSGPVVSIWAGMLAILLLLGAAFTFIWTLVTGLPPGLQLYGLVLTDRQSRPANRMHVMLRTFLTCLTMMALAGNLFFMAVLAFKVHLFVALASGASSVGKGASIGLWGTCVLIFLILAGIAVHACLRPQRAIVDMALGTTIVPK